jgi:hypothetical protein
MRGHPRPLSFHFISLLLTVTQRGVDRHDKIIAADYPPSRSRSTVAVVAVEMATTEETAVEDTAVEAAKAETTVVATVTMEIEEEDTVAAAMSALRTIADVRGMYCI